MRVPFSAPVEFEVSLPAAEVARRLAAPMRKGLGVFDFSRYPYYGSVSQIGCRITYAEGRNASGRVLSLRFIDTASGTRLSGAWRPRASVLLTVPISAIWLSVFCPMALRALLASGSAWLLCLFLPAIVLALFAGFRTVRNVGAQHEQDLLDTLQAELQQRLTGPAPSAPAHHSALPPKPTEVFFPPRKSPYR